MTAVATLHNSGPNFTADIAVVYDNALLLIQRRDGTWALPGGFVDKGETSLAAATRELQEETSHAATGVLRSLYSGHVYDPRQATDRWVETSLFLYQPETSPKVEAADDAQATRWVDLSRKDPFAGIALYADHAFLIAKVLRRLKSEDQASAFINSVSSGRGLVGLQYFSRALAVHMDEEPHS